VDTKSKELKNSGDFHIWPFDFALSSSLEIPTQHIRPALPSNLFPTEIRPGISLLSISVFDFTAESHSLTKPCTEVICGIHVMPNLGKARELPKMSLYLLRMGATTKEFLESPDAVDVQPFEKEPFQENIDKKNIAVECKDHQGRGIFSFHAEHKDPVYTQDLFFIQTFCSKENTLYNGGVFMETNKFEHQKKSRSIGKFHNHSFFQGIDIESQDATDCYIQTWSKPGTQGVEFYEPFKPY